MSSSGMRSRGSPRGAARSARCRNGSGQPVFALRLVGKVREAWAESGKAHDYRKLHDDLVEQGESICLNRVARLTGLAGINGL